MPLKTRFKMEQVKVYPSAIQNLKKSNRNTITKERGVDWRGVSHSRENSKFSMCRFKRERNWENALLRDSVGRKPGDTLL